MNKIKKKKKTRKNTINKTITKKRTERTGHLYKENKYFV